MEYQNPHNETELLRLIANGDEQAFTQLVTPLFDSVFGFALSVTKFPELAEEIVQDTFVRVWQHRTELPSIENLTAWIHTIARNLAYNSIRRQIRDQQRVKKLDIYFALSPASAEDNLLFLDTMTLIEQATRALPAQQALVFSMSRVQGLTLDEITEKLNLSKETVKKHLTHSLKAVRHYIITNADKGLIVLIGLHFIQMVIEKIFF